MPPDSMATSFLPDNLLALGAQSDQMTAIPLSLLRSYTVPGKKHLPLWETEAPDLQNVKLQGQSTNAPQVAHEAILNRVTHDLHPLVPERMNSTFCG